MAISWEQYDPGKLMAQQQQPLASDPPAVVPTLQRFQPIPTATLKGILEPATFETADSILAKLNAKVAPLQFAQSEPAPAPAVEAGVLSDVGNLLKSGYASTAQGINYLGSKIPGVNDLVDFDSGQQYWADVAKGAQAGLSPQQQAAGQKKFINEDYSPGEAWSDPRAYLGPIVESVPGTVIGMGMGAPLAIGAKALGAGAGLAGAVGYGAGEGAIAAGSAGAGLRDDILAMPVETLSKQSPLFQQLASQGVSPEDARARVADETAAQAALQTGLTTAAMGAPTGAMMGKLFHGGGPIAKTMLGTIGVGAAGEAAQEFGQSGAEQLIRNIAVQQNVDPAQSLSQDVLNQAVTGSVAGAVMGGGMGGAGRIAQQAEASKVAADIKTVSSDLQNDIQAPPDEILKQILARAAEVEATGTANKKAKETIGAAIEPLQQELARREARRAPTPTGLPGKPLDADAILEGLQNAPPATLDSEAERLSALGDEYAQAVRGAARRDQEKRQRKAETERLNAARSTGEREASADALLEGLSNAPPALLDTLPEQRADLSSAWGKIQSLNRRADEMRAAGKSREEIATALNPSLKSAMDELEAERDKPVAPASTATADDIIQAQQSGRPAPQRPTARPAKPARQGKIPSTSTQETPDEKGQAETETLLTEPEQAMPFEEVDLEGLTLSEDVPQFKSGANEKGVVEPLGGKFDRTGAAPIIVWERKDGRREIISGRHRADLARRSGEKTIPAQIMREADGFDAKQAANLDAELNIRDGQGKVSDYVQYFRNKNFSEKEANLRGLVSRRIGKTAFEIATNGDAELVAAHRAGRISDEAAFAISRAAPKNARLQAVGLKAIQDGKSAANAANLIEAVKAMGAERGADTGDMFGFDDSAMKEAAKMAGIATKRQRQMSERLAAIQGAARRPEVARREGVDVKDVEALNAKIEQIKAERERWDKWSTDSDLLAEIRKEMGGKDKPAAPSAPAPAPEAPKREKTASELLDEDMAASVKPSETATAWNSANPAERAEILKLHVAPGVDPGPIAEQWLTWDDVPPAMKKILRATIAARAASPAAPAPESPLELNTRREFVKRKGFAARAIYSVVQTIEAEDNNGNVKRYDIVDLRNDGTGTLKVSYQLYPHGSNTSLVTGAKSADAMIAHLPNVGLKLKRKSARAGEAQPEPPLLADYTLEEVKKREAERAQAEAARKAAEDAADAKAKADKDRDTFGLTGSDRPADVAAAAGQTSMLDMMDGKKPSAKANDLSDLQIKLNSDEKKLEQYDGNKDRLNEILANAEAKFPNDTRARIEEIRKVIRATLAKDVREDRNATRAVLKRQREDAANPRPPSAPRPIDGLSPNDRARLDEAASEARRKIKDLSPALQRDAIGFAKTGQEPTRKAIVEWLAANGTQTYEASPYIKEIIDAHKWARPIANYDAAHTPGAKLLYPVLKLKEEERTPAKKEPWQMTRHEYAESKVKAYSEKRKSAIPSKTATDLYGHASDQHAKIVRSALAKGKAVPAEVLADYPDLHPKEPEKTPSAKAPDPEETQDERNRRIFREEIAKRRQHAASAGQPVEPGGEKGPTGNGMGQGDVPDRREGPGQRDGEANRPAEAEGGERQGGAGVPDNAPAVPGKRGAAKVRGAGGQPGSDGTVSRRKHPGRGGASRGEGVRPEATGPEKAAGDAGRPVSQPLASAGNELAQGVEKALDGLITLFGAKAKGRLGSGLSFDEDTYRQAVPLFKEALAHFKQAAQDIRAAINAMIDALMAKGADLDTIEAMEPYITRFAGDLENGAVDLEPTPEPEPEPVKPARGDFAAQREAQRAAESIAVKTGDLENIRATLPYLLPEQQEDVLKAEQRFDGHDGILFTNATGSGKTYSGLGIIKRFVKQGKTNGIIVVPSQAKVSDWIGDGQNLGLDITALNDINDGGKGVVITTYANFYENDELNKRTWDFVMYDESHKLASNQAGEATVYQARHEQVTLRPSGLRARAESLLGAADKAELAELREAQNKADKVPITPQQRADIGRLDALIADERAKLAQLPKPKVVFLSATPFAYHFNLDYANGFLFDWGTSEAKGYNQPNARQAFFIQHFGYRMSYGKLTSPDGGVDVDLMERRFHEWLRATGAVSGRKLEMEQDYSRQFVEIDNTMGKAIDRGIAILSGRDPAGRSGNGSKFPRLYDKLKQSLDFLTKSRLLEGIKAKAAADRAAQHVKMGRKVVVFHDYIEGSPKHPFKFEKKPGASSDPEIAAWNAEVAEFNESFGDLVDLPLDYLDRVIGTFQAKFGDRMRLFNGRETGKRRAAAIAEFNQDNDDAQVIVVQRDAGKEGISLHDVTGKMPRALMDLGLPTAPTEAIQTEGRIYRFGQRSNAIIEYLKTNTSFEESMFASRVATRARTAENLAMGDTSRNLEQAFIRAYIESDADAPHGQQGTGGKEGDARMQRDDPFDVARALYFGQQKKNQRTKAQEGVDYFATPEPVGLKMVEWAALQSGESALEPSAGHGAIARWFPEDASKNTFVEPSPELAARLGLNARGKILEHSFENLHITNKYDAIVMNPPFGQGGATAIAHLEKAEAHLRNGGRIVILLPEGPATDKRFDAFMERNTTLFKVAEFGLPAVTFSRAATTINTRVLVLEKHLNPAGAPNPQSRIDLDADKIGELFDKIRHLSVPPRSTPIPVEKKAAPAATAAPSNITLNAKNIDQTVAAMRAAMQPEWIDASTDTVKMSEAGIAEIIGRLAPDLAKESEAVRARVASLGIRSAYLAGPVNRLYSLGYSVASPTVKGNVRLSEKGLSLLYEYQSVARALLADAIESAPPAPPPAAPKPNPIADAMTPKLAIVETVHAKKTQAAGRPVPWFAVTLANKVSNSAYQELAAKAKKHGGYYSSYKSQGAVPGFQFPSRDKAEAFMAEAGGVQERGQDYEVRDSRRKSPVQANGTGDLFASAPVSNQLDILAPTKERARSQARRAIVNLGQRVESVQSDEFVSALDTVRTPGDAAHVLLPLAEEAQEHMMALVTDKNDKVLAIVRHTVGQTDASQVEYAILLGAVHATPGAANVWFAHNHPSGNIDHSTADMRMTRAITDALEGTGVISEGMIVITSNGEASYFDSRVGSSGSALVSIEAPGAERIHRVPITTRKIRATSKEAAIISETAMKEALKRFSDGQEGVLLMNNAHRPVAFVPMTGEEMNTLRQGDRANALFRAIHETNAKAMAVAVKVETPIRIEGIRNVAAFADNLAMRYLDAMALKDSSTFAERGIDVENKKPTIYRSMPATAGRPTTDAAARAELVEVLGARAIAAMEKAGTLKFSTDTHRTGAAGFVDRSGHITLIPENMDQGTIGVALHEAMHLARDSRFFDGDRRAIVVAHAALRLFGLKNFIGNPGYTDLVQQVHRMAAEGDKIAQAALQKARIEKRADPTGVDENEEALAYLAQYADQRPGLVRRVIAAIRSALYRMGVTMNLSPNDVRSIAVSALKARAKAAKQAVATRAAPAYSIAADATEDAEQERILQEFLAVQAKFQAKQSSQSAFHRWFGKGTEGITARDGKPITLYHGTNNPEFHQWDSTRSGDASGHPTSGLGFFMVADKGSAARYGSRLLELHAKIDKPYYLTNEDLTSIETPRDAARLRGRLQAKGYDGAVVTAPGAAPYVIAFTSQQAKYITNQNPTASEDFRYSRSPRVRRTMAELLDGIDQMHDWHDWYDRHVAVIARMFGEDARLFQDILSATSQATAVKGNVALALKAYRQMKEGAPFESYMPSVAKNLTRIRNNETAQGAKIAEYSKANQDEDSAIAVDRHIAMLFFDTIRPSAAQIAAAKTRIRSLAKKTGLSPRQTQAVLWAYNQTLRGVDPAQVQSYDTILEKRADEIRALRSAFDDAEREGGSLSQRGDAAAGTGEGQAEETEGLRYSRPGLPPVLDHARQALAERGESALSGTKTFLKRLQNPLHGIPDLKDYMLERYLAQGRIAESRDETRSLYDLFSTASAEDGKKIFEYLTTAGAAPPATADPKLKTAAVAAKRRMDDIGRQLVKMKALSQAAYDKYKDQYLPRLYLRHLLKDDEIARVMTSTGRKPDLSWAKRRKDIPEEVRRLVLGEIKDPAYLLSHGVGTELRDMALLDWIKKISQNQNWTLPKGLVDWQGHRVTPFWLKNEAEMIRQQSAYYEQSDKRESLDLAERMDAAANAVIGNYRDVPTGWKQLPNSPRYGALRGMVVIGQIYDDIVGSSALVTDESLAERILGDRGMLSRATALWKWSKVAANPPGQVRNFISNGVLLHLSGVPFHRVPQRVLQAWDEVRNGGDHFKILKKYGGTESTFSNEELRRIDTEFRDLMAKKGTLTAGQKARLLFDKFRNFTGDLYQFSEALFKTAKVIDAMEREGKSEQDAVLAAQAALFDYSLVTPSLRYLRNAPLGMPFITFTSKVLPAMIDIALHHPLRFAPYVALPYVLGALLAGMKDLDDDDVKALETSLPKWLRDKGHAWFLPVKDANDRWQAMDFGYFLPWTTFTAIGEKLAQGKPGEAMAQLGLLGSPAIDIAAAVSTNVDPFTKKEIVNRFDPASVQVASIMNYAWRMAMPTFITDIGVLGPDFAGMAMGKNPFSGKLAEAVTGKTDKYGQPKTTTAQALARLFGANLYPVDPELSRADNLLQMRGELSRAKARMTMEAKAPGLTLEQRKAIVDAYRREIEQREKEMREYARESRITDRIKVAR